MGLYYRNGNLDRSLVLLREAALGDASNPSIEYRRGVVLAAQGNPAGALEALNRALGLSFSFPEAAEARKLVEKLSRR